MRYLTWVLMMFLLGHHESRSLNARIHALRLQIQIIHAVKHAPEKRSVSLYNYEFIAKEGSWKLKLFHKSEIIREISNDNEIVGCRREEEWRELVEMQQHLRGSSRPSWLSLNFVQFVIYISNLR